MNEMRREVNWDEIRNMTPEELLDYQKKLAPSMANCKELKIQQPPFDTDLYNYQWLFMVAVLIYENNALKKEIEALKGEQK